MVNGDFHLVKVTFDEGDICDVKCYLYLDSFTFENIKTSGNKHDIIIIQVNDFIESMDMELHKNIRLSTILSDSKNSAFPLKNNKGLPGPENIFQLFSNDQKLKQLLKSKISNNINEQIKKNYKTKKKLAEETDASESNVNRLLNGKQSFTAEEIALLHNIYDIPLKEIFSETKGIISEESITNNNEKSGVFIKSSHLQEFINSKFDVDEKKKVFKSLNKLSQKVDELKSIQKLMDLSIEISEVTSRGESRLDHDDLRLDDLIDVIKKVKKLRSDHSFDEIKNALDKLD
ncbi:helix-turn-helix domain-containing protein [Guptibacillus hwajinpoensis]|uniref:helix-turn-helix domain-containing protein n=1 Tax=Guptibacillus hwajinpoensis TaxID=208199 RepID=UPI001CFDF608|nr:helix-turn-helix domain-containing protein [Pseudalkalibacillus hwajinpoensis]WLR60168.1 hypothetical protein LC071_01890 [Pseudalkalibacillus hwajinpoensis]